LDRRLRRLRDGAITRHRQERTRGSIRNPTRSKTERKYYAKRKEMLALNGSRQFDVAEDLQRSRRSRCTMAATARRIRLRSYLSAGQKTSKRRRATKGIVQAMLPYNLHNNGQYSAFKSEMATHSYMACVDICSAEEGTTERSGYRTDVQVGGYKDNSRKMPDWKQQDAAESITTKRSVHGKRRHPAPQTNGACRAQSRSPTGRTTYGLPELIRIPFVPNSAPFF
ncbi:hypothetical protein T03_10583, partial [Trichinella britovi]